MQPFCCHDDGADAQRLYPEPAHPWRLPFHRDRDRLIHSTAFRRLRHKTQVFATDQLSSQATDHTRTRLTHSLEVAQIGRSIALALGANEALVEALAYAHDLGHPPFGHSGERILDARLKAHGCRGFDHNHQTLRLVRSLEHRYPEFKGLNLCKGTLEGLIKHNGPIPAERDVLHAFAHQLGYDPASHSSLEGQIAAIADDIAYNHHDIDDGLRAGAFTMDQLCQSLPDVNAQWNSLQAQYPDQPQAVHEATCVRRLLAETIDTLVATSRQRLHELNPQSPEDIRAASQPVIAMPSAIEQRLEALKHFLHGHMYDQVSSVHAKAVLEGIFDALMEAPSKMPDSWQHKSHALPRVVADYIAGMTDQFAIRIHQSLSGP